MPLRCELRGLNQKRIMNRSKSKFSYLSGNKTILIDIDRIESVILDQDNNVILIRMYSGDSFRYHNDDDNEIIDAYYALTDKFREK